MQAPPACRFYRERAAGMYASYPFSAAQVIWLITKAILCCAVP